MYTHGKCSHIVRTRDKRLKLKYRNFHFFTLTWCGTSNQGYSPKYSALVYTAEVFIAGCWQRLPIRPVQNTVIDLFSRFSSGFHVSCCSKIHVKVQFFSVLTFVFFSPWVITVVSSLHLTPLQNRANSWYFCITRRAGFVWTVKENDEWSFLEKDPKGENRGRPLEKDKCILLSLQSLII